MKILIVGSGAREHALGKALMRSCGKPEVYCFGSIYNPGLLNLSAGYWLGNICDPAEVLKVAQHWQIDMAIIGPEAPLEQGLVDCLSLHGIRCIGPHKRLAQIETSKAFTRYLLKKYKIPGNPEHRLFHELGGVKDYLKQLGDQNYVIKANGLAGGKGVKVAGDHLNSLDEAYDYCQTLQAQGQPFLIEEKLQGQEFSLLCFSDGHTVVPMPLVQDHKRAWVGNKGPNTGGMGSYSDSDHCLPYLTAADIAAALAINEQSLQALKQECGQAYVGILYGGFMATAEGVRLIEFNARFGDPEALNLLAILDSDFLALCDSLLSGNLRPDKARFKPLATVCKYAVPQGYPDQSLTDAAIDFNAVNNKEQLYIAGLHMKDNKLYTTISRTAAVVGIGDSIATAEKIAEAEIQKIQGPLYHRKDIGKAELIQASVDHMKMIRQKRSSTLESQT